MIELLSAIAIASVVVAAFTLFSLSQQRSLRHGRADVDASQSLRVALDQMVRDLRMAGRNPRAATSGCGFTAAEAALVTFTFDGDDNGICGETAKNEIRGFRRTGTTLESLVAPGSVAPWETLAVGVSSSGAIFSYQRLSSGSLVAITTLPASSSERAAIGRIDVTLRTNRTGPLGGASRLEAATVLVRNNTL